MILDLRDRCVYGLNATAAALWCGLERGITLDHVAESWGRSGAERERLAGDLRAFAAELERCGLIEVGGEGEPAGAEIAPPAALEAPRIMWSEPVSTTVQQSFPFQIGNPQCQV